MSAARTLAAASLLAWAAAAPAQIRVVNPKVVAPPPDRALTPLSIPAPARPPQPAQDTQPAGGSTEIAPAPQPLGAPPGSGGTLIGGPLPPPPQAAQGAAAALKEDVSVEPAELVAVSADMQEAQQLQQQAQALGLAIKRRAALGNLGLVISVFRVPQGVSVEAALAQLRQALPSVWSDANHRYALEAGPALYGARLVGWPAAAGGCGGGLSLGMIDTAVDLEHPAFRTGRVTQRSFLPVGVPAAKAEHGTAIASLLVGDGGFGLLGGSRLYAAAVFRRRGDDGADTDAELVVRALDWLVGQHVSALNLSFGGPRNRLVEAAILRVEQRGIELLAAAGNGGAHAPPVYPAAQDGVVAVTAVDAKLQPYAHANRGEYIAFAAPGVDVWAAAPGGGGKYRSGTSYAVPFATAVFAAAKAAQPGAAPDALRRLLAARARDLGAPGKDPVFGWGLIRLNGTCTHG
ncbi:MAG TPA: S8 family serine peptidase [Burkholderiales bacterium]|nr:S8 family serine peptidase [Burkholderiales bacterium]